MAAYSRKIGAADRPRLGFHPAHCKRYRQLTLDAKPVVNVSGRVH